MADQTMTSKQFLKALTTLAQLSSVEVTQLIGMTWEEREQKLRDEPDEWFLEHFCLEDEIAEETLPLENARKRWMLGLHNRENVLWAGTFSPFFNLLTESASLAGIPLEDVLASLPADQVAEFAGTFRPLGLQKKAFCLLICRHFAYFFEDHCARLREEISTQYEELYNQQLNRFGEQHIFYAKIQKRPYDFEQAFPQLFKFVYLDDEKTQKKELKKVVRKLKTKKYCSWVYQCWCRLRASL